MERLTKRTEDGVVLIGDTVADMQAAAARALDRLAAYEDKGVAPEDALSAVEMAKVVCKLKVADVYIATGLMPERVAELAQADKDGRLMVLPKRQAWWIKGIIDERKQQDQKWGFPQKNTYCEWSSILAEETGELAKELNELNFGRGDRSRMIIEAVQVAAVALAILEQSGVAHKITEQVSKSLDRGFIPPLCFYGSNGGMCPGMSVDGDDEPVGRCKDCFWCSAGYTQYDTEAVLNEGGSK